MDAEVDARIEKSVRLLRGWRWMSTISNDPQAAADYLTDEARYLIAFGRQHPHRALMVGRLVVAYHRMITKLKLRSMQSTKTAL